MKKSIKFLTVIDRIGNNQEKFKSRRELSYIAKYFLPVYADLFGLPHGANEEDFESLEAIGQFMIRHDYPGHLETTILPEWMGGTMEFETTFYAQELAKDSFMLYHFFLDDLIGRKANTTKNQIAIWFLRFFLNYTPICYNEFEEEVQSLEEWMMDMDDDEEIKYNIEALKRIEREVDLSKTVITTLSKQDFCIEDGDENIEYLNSKSRIKSRKKWVKLIRKIIRFHKIIKGKAIKASSTGHYGSINFHDLFCISMTSCDIIYEHINDRVSQAEDGEQLGISIMYNPEEDKYTIGDTDIINLKYAMNLYAQFLELYYEK